MAPSRALRKVYIYQGTGCAFMVSQTPRTRPAFHKIRPLRESISHRTFGTTISIKADDLAPRRTSRDTKDQTTSQPSPGVPRSRRPNPIDLSSIRSNPGFKNTPSNPPASARKTSAATLSRIDSLLRTAQEKTPSQPTAYNADVYASRRTSAPRSFDSPGSIRDLFSQLNTSKSASAQRTGLENLTSDISREEKIVLRLKPSLGRNVQVRSNDVTRAFQSLESRINTRGNAVRKEEREQKFHVRKGQAKKIERRARWRALFKQGYVAELTRVRKMIKQGW